jgi:hypothetical protein
MEACLLVRTRAELGFSLSLKLSVISCGLLKRCMEPERTPSLMVPLRDGKSQWLSMMPDCGAEQLGKYAVGPRMPAAALVGDVQHGP